MKAGYEGMLAVLQQFLTNQKYSEAHSYRTSMYATRIAESLGLDSGSTEDVRTAALLRNVNEMGISNEILYKRPIFPKKMLKRACASRTELAPKPRQWATRCRGQFPTWWLRSN